MKITSAVFLQGIKGDNDVLENGLPQVAFVGRSNAGKSSLMNSLMNKKDLARASKTPGRTQEMNVFLINDTHLFVDLPGYGFAKAEGKILTKLGSRMAWYLFKSLHDQKIVVLIDALVGPTKDDLDMLAELKKINKEVIIVLNKVDKIKKSQYLPRVQELTKQFEQYDVFVHSSKTKIGVEELRERLLTLQDKKTI